MIGWGALTEGGRTSDQLQSLAIPIQSITDYHANFSYHVNTDTMLVARNLDYPGGEGMALSYLMNHRNL